MPGNSLSKQNAIHLSVSPFVVAIWPSIAAPLVDPRLAWVSLLYKLYDSQCHNCLQTIHIYNYSCWVPKRLWSSFENLKYPFCLILPLIKLAFRLQ